MCGLNDLSLDKFTLFGLASWAAVSKKSSEQKSVLD
jgi:hypothetical protein